MGDRSRLAPGPRPAHAGPGDRGFRASAAHGPSCALRVARDPQGFGDLRLARLDGPRCARLRILGSGHFVVHPCVHLRPAQHARVAPTAPAPLCCCRSPSPSRRTPSAPLRLVPPGRARGFVPRCLRPPALAGRSRWVGACALGGVGCILVGTRYRARPPPRSEAPLRRADRVAPGDRARSRTGRARGDRGRLCLLAPERQVRARPRAAGARPRPLEPARLLPGPTRHPCGRCHSRRAGVPLHGTLPRLPGLRLHPLAFAVGRPRPAGDHDHHDGDATCQRDPDRRGGSRLSNGSPRRAWSRWRSRAHERNRTCHGSDERPRSRAARSAGADSSTSPAWRWGRTSAGTVPSRPAW